MTESREESARACAKLLKPGGEFQFGNPVTRPYSELLAMLQYYVALGFSVFPKFTCDHCHKLTVATTPNEIPAFVVCDHCGHNQDLAASGGNIAIGFNGSRAEYETKLAKMRRDFGPFEIS